MVDTITTVPKSVFAGDRVAFERDFGDYPASTYTVTYYFVANGRKQEIEGTPDGDTHAFEMIATDSAQWHPGRYAYHARAVAIADAADVTTIENGWLVVLPDPSSETSDMRSHARKIVDACNAIIENRAEKNQVDLVNYSLGVVTASRNIDQVIRLRDRYLAVANKEENPDTDRRNIKLRFGSA